MLIMMSIFVSMTPLTFISWSLTHMWLYFCFLISLMLIYTGWNQWDMFNFFLGGDLMSFILISLTIWISILMISASSKIKFKTNWSFFLLMNLLLCLILSVTFLMSDLITFYISFETALIPIFLIVMGWGYQPERLQAGLYLLFYTLFASLPLLICILYMNFSLKMSSTVLLFYNLSINFYSTFETIVLFVGFTLAFLVKLPLFSVHLWLPKAHVEAPVAGSMILAGVLLKLGGYGLLRSLVLFKSFHFGAYILMSTCLFGGVMVGLICLRQTDTKALIAYSSIAHMGLVLGGMLTFFIWGMSGALILMIAHGLCSSALFCLANINYERNHTRSLFLSGGSLWTLPSFSLWWFLFVAGNMAAPPSMNLVGEISIINSLVSWAFCLWVLIFSCSFLAAAYSIYLYVGTQHGHIMTAFKMLSCSFNRELLILFLHWMPLNFFIFRVDYLFCWMYLSSLTKISICGFEDTMCLS
ncbi:NADH dehydrogenase subunit 4 (mitochondrion) [Priapulus caudatus]|uniref:NADH-ubiquinone oxidoreductase chain 4 n=1 Tax=Priapulus caudatus TaxID=37621 RepID=A0MCU3_PRICU|nr:NADH dehydrogenase subunit 4 [Priapulus caudatus]ABE03638.1 NADH dehydrogenase subunit 4 [Priapulus caudatus]